MTRSESGETVESYPGLAMSEADLRSHYEASKCDVVNLVGSEVRQIIGELLHWRNRATLTPTMEAAPVERDEELLRATVRSVSGDIALFAACCDVSGQHDPNWLGIKAKAEEWVADLRAALSSPPEGPDKEGV